MPSHLDQIKLKKLKAKFQKEVNKVFPTKPGDEGDYVTVVLEDWTIGYYPCPEILPRTSNLKEPELGIALKDKLHKAAYNMQIAFSDWEKAHRGYEDYERERDLAEALARYSIDVDQNPNFDKEEFLEGYPGLMELEFLVEALEKMEKLYPNRDLTMEEKRDMYWRVDGRMRRGIL